MGAIFDCLDPILTIASSLSFRDPFVSPMEMRKQADDAKQAFAGSHMSDHFALLAAFDEFQTLRQESSYSGVRQWCHDHFLVADTLAHISDMRYQLAQVRRA